MISAGILAPSPASFMNSGHILSQECEIKCRTAFGFDRGYIRGNFPLYTSPDGQLFGKLSCGPDTKGVEGQIVGIPLYNESPGEEYYIRPEGRYAQLLPDIEVVSFTPIIYIKTERQRKTPTTAINQSCFFIEDPIDAGLRLVEVEPQDCWWKEDSQIVVENDTAGKTIQRAWARFRQEVEGSSDFLVLLESRIQGSQIKTRSHIMTSSQTTALRDLAEQRSRMRKAAFGKKVATDGVLSIHMRTEQDTTEQGMFVVKLAKATALPSVTVNATFELELRATVSGLERAAKRRDEILLEIEHVNQQRGTALTWDSIRSHRNAIDEEKCVLETIEKSQIEWTKEGYAFVKQANSLAETALANGYVPVLEKKSATGDSVPKLNITVPAPDANGTEYVFVAPYANTIPQPGAYIYRKDGDLVWSGIGYYSGFVANFHPTTYNGKTVLQGFQGTMDQNHGEGVGQHVLLDQNYEHVISTKTGNHHIPSIHEFTVVNEKTALVEIYLPTIANLTQWGGNSSQQWLGNGLFQGLLLSDILWSMQFINEGTEFDIATGELVFEWNSLDYLDPADSLNALGSSPSNSGLTIFKINGTDGSIIWQLGGNHSTFTQDFTFGFQHDARWRSQSGNIDVISFFDNSGNGEITFNNVSRALFVQLNHTDNTATVLRKATAPYDLEANSQGNTQLLANDNLFVSWGSAGAFTQFSADNEILYHAFIEDAVSYRGFLANWTGTPSEAPALAAYVDSANTTRLYISWNGDTETKVWKFYQVQEGNGSNAEAQYLGEQSRTSFETSFLWESEYRPTNDVKFYAEAIGGNGDVLVRTLPSLATSFTEITE
ncbi:hypothetical protein AARAC_001004 [Aspergillus arachidicola]|uniref:Uncharacterized protein n=1 Tax=Aspergillus arachidicola TaxID=656916 RepID=A0A2G7G6M7_9EURO|nr:hypothetical protein AARAC_001004 [Aspergillus arachidicola]